MPAFQNLLWAYLFWTGHARQDWVPFVQKIEGLLLCFFHDTNHRCIQWDEALLLQWTTEELAGTTVSSKHTSQGERRDMVKALFHLCSGQWTCFILSAEDRPCKKGFTWQLASLHIMNWLFEFKWLILKPVKLSKTRNGELILIRSWKFHHG